ncbi:LysR family transcriptional regulator [Microbacterium sp. RD1]|uniref:LysR family transcriptional regulator n=1 Tax=Microbacterium sp. RD1 TaxID=3457313 RepID=UPI003FA5F93A
MEIRQLEYFSAIAHEGSFGRAARTLHVSQPALSKQVRALEIELGVELLIRGADGVRATEAGRRLTEMCDVVLDYLRKIPEAVREAPEQLTGTVTVGISPALVPPLADHLRMTFARRHPAVRLQIIEAPPLFLMEWLDLGRLDVALSSRWPPHDESPRLEFTDIGSDTAVLVGAPELLPDDIGERIPTERLHSLPLALSPGYRNLVRRADLDAQPEELGVEIDSLHMIRSLVLRAEYCSVLPVSFVQEDIERGALRAVQIDPPIRRHVAAVTRAGRRPTAAVGVVVSVARARLSDLSAEVPFLGGGRDGATLSEGSATATQEGEGVSP